ncbi:MAG: RdgB/HAM1 family non-canonical purine NTP pyrophosphatase [Bacteroidota bacterium]
MELIFASHNQNKVKEINALLGEGFTVKSLSDIAYTQDIIEDGATLEANALIKARTIYKHTQKNCFADDTGLLVTALQGAPGVYSARYAGAQKNDSDNMDLLLKNLATETDRSARFVTIIALIIEGKEFLFEGTLHGNIITEKIGSNGFGYDPVFMPVDQNRTLAQMELSEKNTISHRARAFDKMKTFLHQNYQTNTAL